jgi:hypothetical protein
MYIILDGEQPLTDLLGQVYEASNESGIEEAVRTFLREGDEFADEIESIEVMVYLDQMALDYTIKYEGDDGGEIIGEFEIKKTKKI